MHLPNTLQRLLLCIAAFLVAFLLFPTSPAGAHTGFESSDPVDGTTVDVAVAEIVLKYSGPADPAGEGFVILDPTGTRRSPDMVTSNAEKTAWTLGFDPPLGDGPVGVRWTVQAPDAHPIDGGFSFTIESRPGASPAGADSRVEGQATPADETGSSPADQQGAAAAEQAQAGAVRSGAVDPTIDRASPEPQDLDSFLTQPAVAAPRAEGIGAFGRLLGFVGTMLGIGGLVFSVHVIRDHNPDIVWLLNAVRYSAVIVVVGTVIDLLAHLAAANNGWAGLWSTAAFEAVGLSPYGVAVGLRIAAGLMLFVAARSASRRFELAVLAVPRRQLVLAGGDGRSMPGQDEQHEDHHRGDTAGAPASPANERWSYGAPLSPAIAAGILLLLPSFTFDGHTVTEGNRWITGVVDMVHVVAGSIWGGGVVALAVVLWRRHRQGRKLNALELAVRFSVIAGAALAAAGLAGTVLAATILDRVDELWSTPWGQLLIAKFIAVAAAASLGSYNHFVVVPWLESHPVDDSRSIRLRNTVTGEAFLLVVVITITAFLVGAAST